MSQTDTGVWRGLISRTYFSRLIFTLVFTDRQLRLLPLILEACGSRGIPINMIFNFGPLQKEREKKLLATGLNSRLHRESIEPCKEARNRLVTRRGTPLAIIIEGSRSGHREGGPHV